MQQKIRVLLVDDSAVIRTMLQKILSSDPDIEVVGTAPDPYVGREKLVALKPDVMILDIEMPKMDGITFLTKVMEHFPTRTIIFSSLSLERSEVALKCLEVGAIDTMAKPAIDVSKGVMAFKDELIAKVKMVAKSKLPTKKKSLSLVNPVAKTHSPSSGALLRTTHQILAVASSTGGTEALKVLLSGLPADIPGTVIVQHMPAVFTKTYAEHLNKMFPFEVKEAEDGDKVLPGRVLIAPGDFHMEIVRSGGYYNVKLHQQPAMHGVRPAADYLLKSVAHYAGSNAIGIVLTGMGKDGAQGLLEMKKAGSYNLAQNEETCVIFGMPKVAIECGAIDKVMPLDEIAGEVIKQMDVRKVS
ncbi:chemotaxis response regulator protein-glutamate methylesterase [Peredibacter sp. HCB2-198]|uniref:protein-glutamate methylesterase/protein-glutamine glutaminase n=1 Tax=Peredibacter sp. HCB2-198 TaxID=3383025 RepID=UPI0038B56E68